MISSPAESVQTLSDRKTIAREVTELLRWRIVRGEMAAGSRVGEVKVATELGISRAPVRESLRELEREGLVRVEAYRGAIVVGVSSADLRDVLLPVRHTLEQYAIANAVVSFTDDDFAELAGITSAMARAVEEDAPDMLGKLVQLDVDFHGYIISRCDNFHIRQLWASIAPRVLAGFYRLGSLHSHPKVIVEEHTALLEVLRGRDAADIARSLTEHVLDSPTRLLEATESTA